MYKMNTAPVASAVALQLQEGAFPVEGEQKKRQIRCWRRRIRTSLPLFPFVMLLSRFLRVLRLR